jgi:hypothetical protein
MIYVVIGPIVKNIFSYKPIYFFLLLQIYCSRQSYFYAAYNNLNVLFPALKKKKKSKKAIAALGKQKLA